MAARRKTKIGLWTETLGHRGARVRLFEKRKGGMLYRATWIREPGTNLGYRSVATLHTYDKAEAIRLGKALLGELLRGGGPAPGPVTLGDLCERFQRDNGEQVNNKPRSRADDAMRARVLTAHFGSHFDVRQLTALHCHQYGQARRLGAIQLADGRTTGPTGQRSIEADLGLLNRMCTWAGTVRIGASGVRWLQQNPLAGVRREREKNPRRPVATWDRFTATRSAIQRLTVEAQDAVEAANRALECADDSKHKRLRWEALKNKLAAERWTKVELALVLAEATGRRLGAIAALRWEDFDFERSRIIWRAESDKKGVRWEVPMPPTLADELRQFQEKLGSVAGLLFPSERDPSRPMHRKQFDKWLRRAETAAGLETLDGGLWHPYRRKWASERMHLPLKAVSGAGGWKNTNTLLTCYQQPDELLLAQVMGETKKLRDAAAAA
jgi:integrase